MVDSTHPARFLNFRWHSVERLLAVVAFAGLLLPIVSGAAGDSLAGWQPEHGHVYRHGVEISHTHPYEHTHSHAHVAPGATLSEGQADPSDVGFTFSQEVSGASAVALITSPAAAFSFPSSGIERLIELTARFAPPDLSFGVPTPPPEV